MTYDLVISNAQICDGSGRQRYSGDIAIVNDRIVNIGALTAHSTKVHIDAKGLTLAPGFIDVHTHDDLQVIHHPQMPAKISQGVTSVIVGNCGISVSPVTLSAKNVNELPDPINLLGSYDQFRYPRFAQYADAVRNAQPAVNVAALIGHTSLRINHLDDLQRPATSWEIALMQSQLADSLSNGAIGLSSGLAYRNALAAPIEEVKALTSVLTQYDAVYTTHLRDEFAGIHDALDEAFSSVDKHKQRLVISHIKCAGKGNWGRSEAIIKQVKSAAANQSVACDCYPYAASSSTLDINQVSDQTAIFVTWCVNYPEAKGRYLADIAAEWEMSLTATAQKLIPAGAIYHCMDEQDVQNFLTYQDTMIGSDGIPSDPHPHPRLWGTFPRVLGHYSRELGLFTVEQAVRKMTSLPAQQFNLRDRGEIRIGAFADLVLFDPANIRDTATFEAPKQAATGIEYVWVNGRLSYSSSTTKHGQCERAGRLLTNNY